MRRLIAALAFAPVLVAAAARTAAACSCLQIGGCGVDDADVIFVGRVLAHWTGPDRVVARFEVERAAKGVYARQIVSIQTGLGGSAACSLDLTIGGRWLIAARDLGDGPIVGRHTRLSAGGCGGGFRIRDGDPGPMFRSRSDVGGRVERFGTSGREGTPMAGVRVWVETPAGAVDTRTDKDGWFLLRDVPLRPARPLHVDVGRNLHVVPTLVAPWTPDVCGQLPIAVQPASLYRPRR
jgi:hypothetical protein